MTDYKRKPNAKKKIASKAVDKSIEMGIHAGLGTGPATLGLKAIEKSAHVPDALRLSEVPARTARTARRLGSAAIKLVRKAF